mmetsp:Transcript_60537/g.131181  ORF Transcript_60537/g.131181 Transcript_60537/m.131181 type:complete len:256 (+) Transcript_60537:519-1286(+)
MAWTMMVEVRPWPAPTIRETRTSTWEQRRPLLLMPSHPRPMRRKWQRLRRLDAAVAGHATPPVALDRNLAARVPGALAASQQPTWVPKGRWQAESKSCRAGSLLALVGTGSAQPAVFAEVARDVEILQVSAVGCWPGPPLQHRIEKEHHGLERRCHQFCYSPGCSPACTSMLYSPAAGTGTSVEPVALEGSANRAPDQPREVRRNRHRCPRSSPRATLVPARTESPPPRADGRFPRSPNNLYSSPAGAPGPARRL